MYKIIFSIITIIIMSSIITHMSKILFIVKLETISINEFGRTFILEKNIFLRRAITSNRIAHPGT